MSEAAMRDCKQLFIKSLEIQDKINHIQFGPAGEKLFRRQGLLEIIHNFQQVLVKDNETDLLRPSYKSLSEKDLNLLNAQLTMLEKLSLDLEQNSSSALEAVKESDKIEFMLPTWKIWLRRALFVCSIIGTAVVVLLGMILLFSPITTFPALVPALTYGVSAILYLLGLSPPVKETYDINLNGIPLHITTLASTALAFLAYALVAPLCFYSYLARQILNPQKEELVHKIYEGILMQQIACLQLQVESINDSSVKQLLQTILGEAQRLTWAARDSWFTETRTPYVQKAKLLLYVAATIVEDKWYESKNVEQLLTLNFPHKSVEDNNYSFMLLLNTNRHRLFKRSITGTMKKIKDCCPELKLAEISPYHIAEVSQLRFSNL